jgi:hypothetical protein
MVSIRDIALSNAYDHTLMMRIIQVKQRHRRTSRRRAPYNTETCGIPFKVVRPPLAAWIEECDDHLRLWIAADDAIASTLIAVATGECQIV